ncbi:hypothetical protein DPMN_099516 [Dreissena polymorpha]|uniref:Uncharacterized protein n=1 Tax=Dreissena polymorpha TaxID=45954 RepID=A0A9D4R6I0_DREPO|nr:hypothetical protein DPMN_099516 [Dreissena polymorpha]
MQALRSNVGLRCRWVVKSVQPVPESNQVPAAYNASALPSEVTGPIAQLTCNPA